mgnify:CR=1 FL=1|tara:strand:+ start:412 stop:588 length:177 start_codon:yes stop_codon:yes gene_type:complete
MSIAVVTKDLVETAGSIFNLFRIIGNKEPIETATNIAEKTENPTVISRRAGSEKSKYW